MVNQPVANLPLARAGYLLYIVIVLGFISCKTTYRLTKQEIDFNPYKIGDTLIFKSNTGERDTVFVLGVNKRKNPEDYLDVFPRYAEHLTVLVKHSDYTIDGKKQRYLESDFLQINKWTRDSASIEFKLSTKNARFYIEGKRRSINLLRQKTNELIVNAITYHDVIIVKSSNIEYRAKNDFIDRIYWSLSSGYIKFDLLNGESWELEKRTNR